MSFTKIFNSLNTSPHEGAQPILPREQRASSVTPSSLLKTVDFLYVLDQLHLLTESYSKEEMEEIIKTANTCVKIKAKASTIGTHISTLKSLRIESITVTNPKESDIRALSFFPHLTHVNLSTSSQLMNYDIFLLSKVKTISHLDITDCELITDSALEHLKALPNLKELNISGLIHISGSGIKHLTTLTKLEALWARRLRRLEISHIHPLLKLKNLKAIDIEGCEKISVSDVQDISKLATHIKIHFQP